MRRWISLLLAFVLAACSGGGGETVAPTTPGSTASGSSLTTEPGTTEAVEPGSSAPYLLVGEQGVVRVDGGIRTQLVGRPVVWAEDDYMGGVVFEYDQAPDSMTDQGVYWLPAGGDEPIYLAPDSGPRFVAMLEGRPTFFYEEEEFEPQTGSLYALDLISGARHWLWDEGWDPAGEHAVSAGGRLVVRIFWALSADDRLVFVDSDGDPVEVPVAPYTDGCYPCRLDARLAPDGVNLATVFHPVGYGTVDENGLFGLSTEPYEVWRAYANTVPATVTITDLNTGAVSFTANYPTWSRLVDFDGRYLVVDVGEIPAIPFAEIEFDRVIVDTSRVEADAPVPSGSRLVHRPIPVSTATSRMTPFWTAVLASLDSTTTTRWDAQARADQLAAGGLETGIVLSDDFASLARGYWVVYSGTFATREQAAAHCAAIEATGPNCYARFVATARSLPEPPEVDLELLEAINAYLPEALGFPTPGRWFCDTRLLGYGRHQTRVDAWAWAKCGAYGPTDTGLTEYASLAWPVWLSVVSTDHYLVTDHSTVRRGETVDEAMLRMFPAFILEDEPLSGLPAPAFPPDAQAAAYYGLPVVGPALPGGLSCRDVEAAGYGYTHAVAYWVREGRPMRMDEDHDRIPCETVYPAAEVAESLTLGAATGPDGTIVPSIPRFTDASSACEDLKDEGHPVATILGLWIREMATPVLDADGNGIPCDEVYAPAEVAALFDFDSVSPRVTTSLQPGDYTTASFGDWNPYSGMQREDGTRIGVMDDDRSFSLAEHVEADLLWFTEGAITWEYPVPLESGTEAISFDFVLEVSSEAPQAAMPHPSSMTVSVNGTPIGEWIIPGDPDGTLDTRGSLPALGWQRNHFASHRSQYGWLTRWHVDATGSYVGYEFRLDRAPLTRISDVSVSALGIEPERPIRLTVIVRPSETGSGLNLYGDTWGDHPVDPTVVVGYRTGSRSGYTVGVLGPGRAAAINDAGQVVGQSSQGHAVMWDLDGDLTDLHLAAGWDLKAGSEAFDINNRGQIVGFDGAKSVMIEPGSAPGSFSSMALHFDYTPMAINDAGVVVGGEFGAYRWTRDSGKVRLDNVANGIDVNNGGDLLGVSSGAWDETLSPAMHLVVVDEAGNLASVLAVDVSPVYPHAWAEAGGINNAGEVVYSVATTPREGAPTSWAGYRWAPGARTSTFPGLALEAINDQGAMAGWRPGGGPILIDTSGEIIELPIPPGYSTGTATDVSESGAVCGYVQNRSGPPTAVVWIRQSG